MSYMSKFVAAVVGLLVMAIVASRQLFLFAVFRDSQGLLDSQGGKYHLWLAFSAGIAACTAGGLMFHFFLRHERNKWSQAPKAHLGPAIAATSEDPTPAPFDAIRWAQLNPWLSEGQADDRRPMHGTDGDSSGSLSVRRSTTRRTHQMMYKKWSQARHD